MVPTRPAVAGTALAFFFFPFFKRTKKIPGKRSQKKEIQLKGEGKKKKELIFSI